MNYLSKIIKANRYGPCMGTDSVQRSLLIGLVLAFLGTPFSGANAQGIFMQSNVDNTLHQENMIYYLSYTGNYRDFEVPAEAAGKYLFIEARGGDGGTIDFRKNINPGEGGQGAYLSAFFKIGRGANEIPIGSTIRTIIGGRGGSFTNTGQTYYHGGGGGGGTGIVMLPAGIAPYQSKATDWVILMVAGGGGGGFAKWGGNIDNGYPANNRTEGLGYYDWSDAREFYGADSYAYVDVVDNCGAGANGGGGANIDPNIGNGYAASDSLSGFGGFQREYGKIQPVGHAGASGGVFNPGGFGFGSGGRSGGGIGGGGGGYMGGNGTHAPQSINPKHKRTPAGGGGSYVNADYAFPGSIVKVKNGTTLNSEHGHVRYKFFDSVKLQSMSGGQQYTTTVGLSLLTYGNYTLRWQRDGNLVLYDGQFSAANAKWASGTESRGKKLVFQKDGNLVILDANNQAIWATATADAQQDGKGGVKLVLSPFGKLVIHDTDYLSIWSAN